MTESIADPATDRPSLLCVFAHPDDETYLGATLMQRVLAAGGTVTLVTATKGEVGAPYPELSSDEIAGIREHELRTAMGRIGVDDVRFLGCIDGQCEQRFDSALEQLTEVMAERLPDLVVTFGPDGISRHSDHVAVSRATTAAWDIARERGQLPVDAQLLYACISEAFAEHHFAQYPDFPLTLSGEPAIIADDDIVLCIDPTDEEFATKTHALSAHKTQTRDPIELLGADRYFGWWRTENFRRPTVAEIAEAHRTGTAANR